MPSLYNNLSSGARRKTINGTPGRPVERMTQPLGGSHSGDVATAKRRKKRRQSAGVRQAQPPGSWTPGNYGPTGNSAMLARNAIGFSLMPPLGTTNLGPDFGQMAVDQARAESLYDRMQQQRSANDARTGMNIPTGQLAGLGGQAMAPPASRIGTAQRLAQQNALTGFAGMEDAAEHASQFRNPGNLTPRQMTQTSPSQLRQLLAGGQPLTQNQSMAQKAYSSGSIPRGGAGFVGEGPTSQRGGIANPRPGSSPQNLFSGMGGAGQATTAQRRGFLSQQLEENANLPFGESTIVPSRTNPGSVAVHGPAMTADQRAEYDQTLVDRLRRRMSQRHGVPYQEGRRVAGIQNAARAGAQAPGLAQTLLAGGGAAQQQGPDPNSPKGRLDNLINTELVSTEDVESVGEAEVALDQNASTLWDHIQAGRLSIEDGLRKADSLDAQSPAGVGSVRQKLLELYYRNAVGQGPAEPTNPILDFGKSGMFY